MHKVDLSICASAIRPQWWQEFYNSLKGNIIKYEVIFVGNVKPQFELPYNFKWIYSDACPAQCYQIAFDHAGGEWIHWTADDVTYGPFALDIWYKTLSIQSFHNVVFAFNCIENGSPTSKGHRLDKENSPMMAPLGIINSDILRFLGGYDRRFKCGQSENDLVMRLYEIGGRLILCEDAIAYLEHNKKHGADSVFRSENGHIYHVNDRAFLTSCWLKPDGSVSKNRLIKFEGFTKDVQYL